MKRIAKCLIAFVLVIAIAASCVVTASGASNKYSYTNTTKRSYVKVDGKNIGGDFHYQLIQVKGKSTVKNKINKGLKTDYKKFVNAHWNDFITYSIMAYNNQYQDPKQYFCTIDSKVTSNTKNIFSVKKASDWFAGGVHNLDESGLVYSKKTGKQLYLSHFIKGNTKQINKKVKKAFLKKLNCSASKYSEAMQTIANYKIKDYKIYVSATRVYVCFDPYELGLHNNHLTLSLKREDK